MKLATEGCECFEPEEEMKKLRSKISQFARNIALTIDMQRRPLSILINEYADALFAQIFLVLGERPWLAQAHLHIVLDTSITELFPREALDEVPMEELQSTIYAAYERSVDEQRAVPL